MATTVLSTRLDDDVIAELNLAVRRLKMTKKQFLEEAIRMRAEQPIAENEFLRVLRETAGAWVRDETPEETVEAMRQASAVAWDRRRAYFDSLVLDDQP
ncbi:MAG: hypothetical protein ACKVT1_13325 [Dehalococcoidia bacterium]